MTSLRNGWRGPSFQTTSASRGETARDSLERPRSWHSHLHNGHESTGANYDEVHASRDLVLLGVACLRREETNALCMKRREQKGERNHSADRRPRDERRLKCVSAPSPAGSSWRVKVEAYGSRREEGLCIWIVNDGTLPCSCVFLTPLRCLRAYRWTLWSSWTYWMPGETGFSDRPSSSSGRYLG